MDCPRRDPLSDADFLRQFNRKATEQRVRLSGSIELTRRCNLRCVHCYLARAGSVARVSDAESSAPEVRATQRCSKAGRELSTAEWLSILDQGTEAGCLELLITGGEPLLRPDFATVYRHAKGLGLLVTVFTNGTLVTEELAALFADLPPRQIEITVYGATPDTYEAVTGVPGSFARCMTGLRRLLDARLPVDIKTILMTINRHEFSAMRQVAEGMGVKFRFDAAIFPRFDGDRAPLRLRVPPREAVAWEMANERIVAEWRGFVRRQGAIAPPKTLYQCGAGVTAFHVDASGSLRPCLMVAEPSCSLLDRGFREGWDTVIPRLHERMPKEGFACRACEKRALCGYCPAFFALENGAEDAGSDYLCALGRLRYAALNPVAGDTACEQREGGYHELRDPATEEAGLRQAQAPSH
ncbi:MAG: radical SAM protein [Planctomycetes bacterium]|nr:radical SAM protein [Planctomycetota bacterium]